MTIHAPTKRAWIWAFSTPTGTIGFPGLTADLYFSSPEAFAKLLGRPMAELEYLLEVEVPADFDNWDYIPNDY